jgi:hypothetical protein
MRALLGRQPGREDYPDQQSYRSDVILERIALPRGYNAATGTLRYTVSSIVRDKDSFPDNYFRHKVTILGLKPISVPPIG